MSYVILWRNPSNDRVGFISEENCEDIAVFESAADVQECLRTSAVLKAWPYAVINLEGTGLC